MSCVSLQQHNSGLGFWFGLFLAPDFIFLLCMHNGMHAYAVHSRYHSSSPCILLSVCRVAEDAQGTF